MRLLAHRPSLRQQHYLQGPFIGKPTHTWACEWVWCAWATLVLKSPDFGAFSIPYTLTHGTSNLGQNNNLIVLWSFSFSCRGTRTGLTTHDSLEMLGMRHLHACFPPAHMTFDSNWMFGIISPARPLFLPLFTSCWPNYWRSIQYATHDIECMLQNLVPLKLIEQMYKLIRLL